MDEFEFSRENKIEKKNNNNNNWLLINLSKLKKK